MRLLNSRILNEISPFLLPNTYAKNVLYKVNKLTIEIKVPTKINKVRA